MANSLLDFVMSLVRDPEAAAQYAADPAQAIAGANLTDVTSADVNQLIPVVAESLSSASLSSPTAGADPFGGAEAAPNVWASGAATEAFDAFDDQLPQQLADDPQGVINDLIGSPDYAVLDTIDVPTVAGLADQALQMDAPVIDDLPFTDAPDPDWVQHVVQDYQADHLSTPDNPGFEDLI